MHSMSKQKSATPLFLCSDAKFLSVEDEFHCIQFGELLSSSSDHIRPLHRKVNKTYAKFFNNLRGLNTPQSRAPDNLLAIFHHCSIVSRVCIEPISKHPYHPKHTLRLIFTDPIHKECLNIPCIIRISRHEHRIFFNSSLTPEKLICGVCHRKIDTNYGRYSCVKGCNYGVHSKCATRKDGKPEDPYEDISSFIEISEGIIQHFSHQDHHMRLDEKTDRAFHEKNYCQACTLPICDDIIYSCMQCDFIFHKECAQLPRKKHQVTHPHSLSLQVGHQGCALFECKAYLRSSNGFAYLCDEEDCEYMLDVRCASIAEPLDHRCHQHPLFLIFEPRSKQIYSVCHKSRGHRLNCGECGFVACFGCATLPNKLRYKHDEHVLLFSYEEEVNGQYFCEVCEKEANPKNRVYMCHDCNVTLHIKCLLGKDVNIMHGVVIEYPEVDVSILLNDRLIRNICKSCDKLCEHKIVYEVSDFEICSLKCLNFVVLYFTMFA
ncbi:LOW QUALITY PROTEIN: hypothetical protein HID58_096373 [Brassica napus]|uniref:Cysteine/Histidine-rich C1 domain family protein n=1 Tax=Brassica napus TaxID=3708 RepID=A0ABQ7X0T5_BRANA|nr:LOW QUALITY PROTEIN: hypothetical protein HID58_096373 [Brassica napus]